MSRICEHFKLNKDGVCENFIISEENRRKKTSCSYSCKIYKAKGKTSKSNKQIIGLYVPYETASEED